MNTLINGNDDVDDLHGRSRSADREITLGTTMVLGIFFALAVLCAVFFGFGYSIGARRSGGPAAAASTAPAANSPATSFTGSKPSPNSPIGGSAAAKTAASQNATALAKPISVPTPKQDVDAMIAGDHVPPAPKPAAHPVAAPMPPTVAVLPGTAQAMVQIAAVSHQEDADLLISTLKRRGYSVAIHNEPQDKLLHVQVGPFATKKDAEVMRQRLLADGFNAIVK